jgi:hypothetical protein
VIQGFLVLWDIKYCFKNNAHKCVKIIMLALLVREMCEGSIEISFLKKNYVLDKFSLFTI